MASIYPFQEEADHTEATLFVSYKIQNEVQSKVSWAATKIQSFFRGLLVRMKIGNDSKAAIVIQKHVRGWLLRYHLPDKLQEYYDELCFKFYNKAAARIQATWKGYVFRKFTFCIKDVLAERARIAKGNEEMYRLFKQPFNEFNKTHFEISEDYIHKIYKILFDRHHLLRTKHVKGVLSKQETEKLSVLEELIKVMTWKDFIAGIHKIFYDSPSEQPPVNYKFSDKHLKMHEDFIRYMTEHLIELPQMQIEYDKKYDFTLNSKIDRKPVIPILTRGRFVPPIKNRIRVSDSIQNVACKQFDLTIPNPNQDLLKPKKSGYNINFWSDKCSCGQRERFS